MKKRYILGCCLAVGVLASSTPARADRTVMVMLQEVPTTMSAPAGSSPVTFEIKMDAKMMAEMKGFMSDGSMTLTCMSSGPQIMMCHGK